MDQPLLRLLMVCVVSTTLLFCNTSGASYKELHTLYEKLLGKANYNPEMRPVLEHKTITNVTFDFALVFIQNVDDVEQTLKAIGFFTFKWKDEIVTWNPSDQFYFFQVHPKDIWKPRMTFGNSIELRYPFQDVIEQTTVMFTGDVSWIPGFLTPIACALNMDKYPFDTQICQIEFCPMSFASDNLRFINRSDKVDTAYYFPGDSWDLVSTNVLVRKLDVGIPGIHMTCGGISLEIKRKPTYFIINIILPILSLSFLNIFVFVIPVASGEKIGYAITVLLSHTVFLSEINSIMPKSSDTVPAVTIYLTSLLMGAVLTVIVAIGIVALHNKDEEREDELKVIASYQHAVNKLTNVQHAIQAMNHTGAKSNATDHLTRGQRTQLPTSSHEEDWPATKTKDTPLNRYRVISNYIDTVCFFTFLFLWTFATAWYFIYVHS